MNSGIRLVILLIFTILSFWRNSVWLNDGTLWLDTLSKSPDKARGYNELGLYEVETKNYSAAFDPLFKSLELDPYQPTVYINLGLAYEGVNQLEMAVKMYERSISLKSDDPVAYYNLGVIYYKEYKDSAKALDLFLKARDLNPDEPDVHYNLQRIYRDMGDYPRADDELRLFHMLK